MNPPQEPVSPSPSTPSSGSPPPDEILTEQVVAATSQQLTQAKRRLQTGATHSRDLKSRRRDDGAKRNFGLAEGSGREGAKKEDLLDTELMERLKHDFGDPFDESGLNASLNQ